MFTPNPFTPTREAITKLLIASTDLAEAASHFQNALRRIEEAQQLAPEGSALKLSCACLKLIATLESPASAIHTLRSSMNDQAHAHYPEALTEEI